MHRANSLVCAESSPLRTSIASNGRNTPDGRRFAVWLFVAVFASRALTSSSAYFADAHSHLAAIHRHTYVIQAPGYWLFNRTAGLFPDPAITIAVMNWWFSAAGAVVLYLAARRLASERVARISAVAYGTVFFAWMTGNVHSTYASQLFFPVAAFLCFLHYGEKPRLTWAVAGAIVFAVGAGFRPPDGVFFAPAFLYGLSRCKRPHALACLAIAAVLCLLWVVPQQIALSKEVNRVEGSLGRHLGAMADGVLVVGFSRYALSNVLRLVVPLMVGVLPLLALAFGNRTQPLLWIWVLPGMAFYLLIYFPGAPYLVYMLGAVILLAVTNPTATDRRKIWCLAVCAVLNVGFYVAWRPIRLANPTLQLAEYVIDADAGKYGYYGVQHHYQPRLSELLHQPGYEERSRSAGE